MQYHLRPLRSSIQRLQYPLMLNAEMQVIEGLLPEELPEETAMC